MEWTCERVGCVRLARRPMASPGTSGLRRRRGSGDSILARLAAAEMGPEASAGALADAGAGVLTRVAADLVDDITLEVIFEVHRAAKLGFFAVGPADAARFGASRTLCELCAVAVAFVDACTWQCAHGGRLPVVVFADAHYSVVMLIYQRGSSLVLLMRRRKC